jgi:hypothetical protein
MLGPTGQYLVATVTWPPEFVHHCLPVHLLDNIQPEDGHLMAETCSKGTPAAYKLQLQHTRTHAHTGFVSCEAVKGT